MGEKKSSKDKSLWDFTTQFFNGATIHGYSHVFAEAGIIRRIAWTTLCIALTIYAFYQIGVVISDYQTYPKKITRNIKEDTTTEFPAITVCNLSPFPITENIASHKIWGAFFKMEEEHQTPNCEKRDKDKKIDIMKKNFLELEKITPNEMQRKSLTRGRDLDRRERPKTMETMISGNMKNMYLRSKLENAKRNRNQTTNLIATPKAQPNSISRPKRKASTNGDPFTDVLTKTSNLHNLLSSFKNINDTTEIGSYEDQGIFSMSDALGRSEPDVDDFKVYLFTCSNGLVLNSRSLCNGYPECPEEDDEKNCSDECSPGFMFAYGSCYPETGFCGQPPEYSYMYEDEYTIQCSSDYESCGDGFFKCQDGKCIRDMFRCDGMWDCINDEEYCETCVGFSCGAGNSSCVSIESECNGYPECPNGEDEEECVGCRTGLYTCDDGTCIPYSYLCDNYDDCSSAEDEMDCSGTEIFCLVGDFICGNAECLHPLFVCDGVVDCIDGSDEQNCTECSGTSAMDSMECRLLECDMSVNIFNGSVYNQEYSNCSCPIGYMTCSNGKCINPRFLCDGYNHCPDGGDENLCELSVNQLPVHDIRMKCSEFYHSLLIEHDIQPLFEPFEMDPDCYTTNGTFLESIYFSPLCQNGVVCDFFGCYDLNFKHYREYRKMNTITCTKCGMGEEVCWASTWIKEWKEGVMSHNTLKIMLMKDRQDFSDVFELFSLHQMETNSTTQEDVIFSCIYDRQNYDYKDFVNWRSKDYGNCYTFNSALLGNTSTNETSWPKKTTSAGPKHGLRMTLNIPSGLSILSPEVGVRVIIHSPHIFPVPEEEGFNIGPGTTSVSISRTENIRIGPPHGVCTSKPGEEMPFEEYNRLVCKQMCLEKELRLKCNCTIGLSPIYDGLKYKPKSRCNPTIILQKICKDMVIDDFMSGTLKCDCDYACREMKYEPRVTSSKVNDQYFKLLHQFRKGVGSLCSRFTELFTLDVYLDSMAYEQIKEVPAYTFDTLLSNIGGSLGLFIGVSIVTIVEILQFAFDFTMAFIRRDKEHKETDIGPDSVISARSTSETGQLEKEIATLVAQVEILLKSNTRMNKELDYIKHHGFILGDIPGTPDIPTEKKGSNFLVGPTFDKMFLKKNP